MSRESVGELQIAVVGRRKVGKSLLANQIISQDTSITNGSVYSAFEPLSQIVQLLPTGLNVVMNIASVESKEGEWGKRTSKCLKAISNADLAILVLDAREELDDSETELIAYLCEKGVPFLVAVNKIEYGTNPNLLGELDALDVIYFEISCKENAGIEGLRKKLIHILLNNKHISKKA